MDEHVQLVTFTGPHDPRALQKVVAFAEQHGFALRGATRAEGTTGKPVAPQARLLSLVPGVEITQDAFLGIGMATVADIAGLSLLAVWRRLRLLYTYTPPLGPVATYMAANNLSFADCPAQPLGEAWLRYREGGASNLFPELGTAIDVNLRSALANNTVFCRELAAQIPDVELANLRKMSKTRVAKLRAAIAVHQDA